MAKIPESALESSSPYLKASDHEDLNRVVTIKDAGDDEVTWPDGSEETIYYISFGASKPIKLSKTNMRTLVGLFGNDTKDWVGNKVLLSTRKYDINGKQVVGWTISREPDRAEFDDEIPF